MIIDTETGQRRRRVRLTPVRSIPVEFAGERSGEAPLTLGQLNVYTWMTPDDVYTILRVELPVPKVVRVHDVAEATAVLIARHESLRTTYPQPEGGYPRQRVAAVGVQLLEVYSLGEGQWGPQDRPAVAEALVMWLRESPDPMGRPVRMAVAIASPGGGVPPDPPRPPGEGVPPDLPRPPGGGVPPDPPRPDADNQVIACAAAFSHLAVDHDAIEILKRDFADLLGHPAASEASFAGRPDAKARRAFRPGDAGLSGGSGGRSPLENTAAGQVGRRGHQPLDQAALEATPAERRRADAALDHLRKGLLRMPRCLYALPGTRASGESLAVELSSAAAAMAVQQVAARTRTSRSSIVLAAICAVIARRASYREVVFPVASSNRFERHLVNYVGSLAQGTIATVEIGGRSFDELVRHTWTAVMEASRHARYDTVKRIAMDQLIEHERGLCLSYGPLFNSLVPESWSALTAGVGFQTEEIDHALARTELPWRPMPVSALPIRFTLNQIDGCLRLDMWSGDAGLLPRAELESVLRAVERLLAAAARGDVTGSRMPTIIGLEPLAGTPDRILVDSCWVEVADVQRLVNDAIAPAASRVFATVDGRPLVACLTATDTVRTPEQAHARCMAVLAHHPTAITPRHYVICRTAPPDPTDPTAWSAPLATGTGRDRADQR